MGIDASKTVCLFTNIYKNRPVSKVQCSKFSATSQNTDKTSAYAQSLADA